jgi:hypothetical protein
MERRGPVDMVLIEFPGNQFNGEILPELERLAAEGTVRILDALLVSKDGSGNIKWFEAAEVDDRFGALVGDPAGLLAEEDAEAVAEELEPDSSLGVLLFEHSWAAVLTNAVRESNGRVLDWERVPAAAIDEMDALVGEGR